MVSREEARWLCQEEDIINEFGIELLDGVIEQDVAKESDSPVIRGGGNVLGVGDSQGDWLVQMAKNTTAAVKPKKVKETKRKKGLAAAVSRNRRMTDWLVVSGVSMPQKAKAVVKQT